jgi:hypothetical protein
MKHNITFNIEDIMRQPMADKRITMTRLTGSLVDNQYIIAGDPITLITDANGSVVFTNVIDGRYGFVLTTDTTTTGNLQVTGSETNLNATDLII